MEVSLYFFHMSNIVFCFSDQQRTELLLLLLSLLSSVLQFHREEGNFFLEYGQINWFYYAEYYLKAFSSLLFVRELLHYLLSLNNLSSPLSSSTAFQSSPKTSTSIFLVSRSLSHIKQCSKHNT